MAKLQKSDIRQRIWDQLQDERLARFPFPPHGRIPNFAQARAAAEQLLESDPLRNARRIKANPDAPQRPVRQLALQRGIVVYMPTPRLRGGFMMLDPDRIPEESIRKAASLNGCGEWAVEIPIRELPAMDAIVCGSVAVDRKGNRCGKGEGYSDIEYAILRELGHPPVPVVTTVHDIQIVNRIPHDKNDLPLSMIVTPTRTIEIESPLPPPDRIDWDALTDEDLDAMPILKELR